VAHAAIGLYVHVPFCRGKCPYCDFYSLRGTDAQKDAYTERVCQILSTRDNPLSTVYLGGGTPSQLGTARLLRILEAVQGRLVHDAEITLEINPSDVPDLDCAALRRAGYNRVSLGLQSAVDTERRALGRRGNTADVARAVQTLQSAGFANISLDVMLAVPGQSADSLRTTLQFATHAGVQHVSAYLLKIEPGTPFAHRPLDLPDEDAAAELYIQACETLEKAGFAQYEISNFARPGFESQHNLKYWRSEEYWGVGPGAHSFLAGQRFFAPRDLAGFLAGDGTVPDGRGGDFAEYTMLALRLREGLRADAVQARFGHAIPAELRAKAAPLERHGLLICDENGMLLTRKGFLLSNAVIGALLA
jgi:oxygen-independent coproporphyrinogen-3 oxidase